MLSKLMQINSNQESTIRLQSYIIDELFALLCHYMPGDGLDGIEPLLNSMKDAVERREKMMGG